MAKLEKEYNGSADYKLILSIEIYKMIRIHLIHIYLWIHTISYSSF